MTHIYILGDPRGRQHHDVTPLVEAMRAAGFLCSPDEARLLWALYSDSVSAGWVIMDGPDLVTRVEPFFQPFYDAPNRWDAAAWDAAEPR